MSFMELDKNGNATFRGVSKSAVDRVRSKGSQVFDTNEIEQLLIITQIYSGKLYSGTMSNIDTMTEYIVRNAPVQIQVAGDFHIFNALEKCRKTVLRVNQMKHNIDKCFANQHNTTGCLLRQATLLQHIQDELLVCKPGEREKIQDKYDISLSNYIDLKSQAFKCKSKLCKLQQERDAAYNEISVLESINSEKK